VFGVVDELFCAPCPKHRDEYYGLVQIFTHLDVPIQVAL
jgi:hypothetical protein